MAKKGRVYKPWTNDEIQRMLELKKTSTIAHVGEVLGRSRKSIEKKLKNVVMKGAIQITRYRQWSDDDRAMLRRMWPDHSRQEVATALGRDVRHVVDYARYMGLGVSQQQRLAKGWQPMERKDVPYAPWTRAQADELLQLLETRNFGEVASAIGRSVGSVQYMSNVLKNGKWSPSGYRVWSAEEKETLRLLWFNHSLAEVAAATGRSKPSVRRQALKLGLKKSAARLMLYPGSAYLTCPPELRECIQLAKQIERRLGERQDHRQPA